MSLTSGLSLETPNNIIYDGFIVRLLTSTKSVILNLQKTLKIKKNPEINIYYYFELPDIDMINVSYKSTQLWITCHREEFMVEQLTLSLKNGLG